MIIEMNERSRTIFKYIVDSYLGSGSPVGSRTVSKLAGLDLSPASIRNSMADLEDAGLLYAPHTSAGRIPTEHGIRLYIEGIMQISNIDDNDKTTIEQSCSAGTGSMDSILESTGHVLSGLSSCASLVIAPKMDRAIKQIQFTQLGPRKILTILLFDNDLVENRIIDLPHDVPPASLISASNYLNATLTGKTLIQAGKDIRSDIQNHQTQLDTITQRLIEKGLALPANAPGTGRIIVRGQSNLLQDVKAIEDLESARELLAYLEHHQNMLGLLDDVDGADGVQIFIGSDNKIFDQSGWSMILSPYKDAQSTMIGAIGVIGPTRLNYDRIIPMVDYTSRLMSKLVDS